MLAQLTAVWCAALLATFAFYVTTVAPPILVTMESRTAQLWFSPSRRGGLVLQALLAFVGLIAGMQAWRSGSGAGWFLGALGLGLVLPFTLAVMFTTRWKIRDTEDPDEALGRLLRWAEIQTIRAFACAFALLTFYLSLSR